MRVNLFDINPDKDPANLGGVYDRVPRFYPKFNILFDPEADDHSKVSSCIERGLQFRAEKPKLNRIMNVRHPFSRLLSAWRDKFSNATKRGEQYLRSFRPILKV